MLSYAKNSWRSEAMICSKFLEKISHFHCLLKIIILRYRLQIFIIIFSDIIRWKAPYGQTFVPMLKQVVCEKNSSREEINKKNLCKMQ